MPYISLTIKKNSKESLTTIFVQKLFICIFHLTENCGHHDDIVINSDKQELVFLCTKLYRTSSHECTKVTVSKTKVTIFLMQPMLSQSVARYLRCHFEWHIILVFPGHPQIILGAYRDRMHEIKVSLDGFIIRSS